MAVWQYGSGPPCGPPCGPPYGPPCGPLLAVWQYGSLAVDPLVDPPLNGINNDFKVILKHSAYLHFLPLHSRLRHRALPGYSSISMLHYP